MKYYLSLGSNIGNRGKNLSDARFLLEKEHIKILKSSSIYETQPVDYSAQPWFLNQMLEVNTVLLPDELLDILKKIEAKLGRLKSIPKGPREIDIDIILCRECTLDRPDLQIPHQKFTERRFVLAPLAEIEKDLYIKITKRTITELLNRCPDQSYIQKLATNW